MNRADIPGFTEAVTALIAADYAGDEAAASAVTMVVLAAATPVIMAAMLADLADELAIDQPKFLDSAHATAKFLDTMSSELRGRTGQ